MRYKIIPGIFIFFWLFFFNTLFSFGQSLFILNDNVSFKFDDDSYLILLTDNPDSVNPYLDKPCIQPSSSNNCFSIVIRNHDTSKLKMTFKDLNGVKMGTLVWNKLSPGIYRFDWWKYYCFKISGVYHIDVKYKDIIETKKIIFIK